MGGEWFGLTPETLSMESHHLRSAVRCASESVTEQQFCGALPVIFQPFGQPDYAAAATHDHAAAEDHAELAELEHAP